MVQNAQNDCNLPKLSSKGQYDEKKTEMPKESPPMIILANPDFRKTAK
jgi:hypothetical protein